MPQLSNHPPRLRRVICLDIETYGALPTNPPQHHFVPERSAHLDGVPAYRQILTCAITPCWCDGDLTTLEPAPTMVLDLTQPTGLTLLSKWLRWCDTLLGMNLLFDLHYLAYRSPLLNITRYRPLLVDLSIINYLHSEIRPERSLKSLGPILGTHVYRDTLSTGTINTYEELRAYNAQDTHNTVLAIAALARLIRRDFPNTDKLSSSCLSFYSDAIYSCLAMTLAGVPFSWSALRTLRRTLEERRQQLLSTTPIPLEGAGLQKGRQEFLARLLEEAPSILDDELLVYTSAKRQISFNALNRTIFRTHLSPSSPLLPLLDAIDEHAHIRKILSSYLIPMMEGRQERKDRSSVLVLPPSTTPYPLNRDVRTSHPTWFITPSPFKDSSLEGGTLQGRITCKRGSHQTDPPEIQRCRCSRYRDGVLLSMDLSQIELRVAALLSGEETLLRAFQENLDLHTNRARDIWGDDVLISRYPNLADLPPTQWKTNPSFNRRERQVGKRVSFADLFRSGARTMRSSVYNDIGELFPLSFFADIVRNRPRHRPTLHAWQERLLHQAATQHYLVLPVTGQSRYFFQGEKHLDSEIVNFPVQTTASNTLLRIQAYTQRHLPPHCLIYLNVFDALYIDCPSPDSAEYARLVLAQALEWVATSDYWAILQEHVGRTVPLKADFTIKANADDAQ
ncbi:MAG: hypothetical protein D6812_02870 [Deltaproteobacteria bacterium]|nr:MAG: hypothetical protein D6812_02870 [Deltaproteobacteria bacterium]